MRVIAWLSRWLRRFRSFARRFSEIARSIYHLDQTAKDQSKTVSRLEILAERVEAATQVPHPKSGSPFDSLSVAVVGVRGHGKRHIDNYLRLDDCHVSYICDVDSAVGAAGVGLVEMRTGRRPRLVSDLREVLADPSVDIVSLATPNHWHALGAFWALQAGKHVYIEKPISHTYDEGLSVIAAAEKYGRVVQHGTQLRSNSSLAAAASYMREGSLGNIEVVHCITYKVRLPLPSTVAEIPETIDYDMWLGPASNKPLNRPRLHYDWHWYWDYGNGPIGNNGVHRLDVARIGLGLEGLGDLVVTIGGRFGEADSAETPNTSVSFHKFGSTWVVQEVRSLGATPRLGVSNGIIFYGDGRNITYHKGKAATTDDAGEILEIFPGRQQNHYENFIDAVKRNDPGAVTGDVYQAHLSSGLCHLANISYQIGKPASDEEIRSHVSGIGIPAAAERVLANVRADSRSNQGGEEDTVLGDVLKLGTVSSPLAGNEAAAALLTKPYREPYQLPKASEIWSP